MTTPEVQRRFAQLERTVEAAAHRGPKPLSRPSVELAHELLDLAAAMTSAHAEHLLVRAERLARDVAAGQSTTLIRARLTALAVDVARAVEERGQT